MASLTFYVAIWTALIVVGVLMFPNDNSITNSWNVINAIYSDPITAIPGLVSNMFTGTNGLLFLSIMLGVTLVGGITNIFSGGGFTLLFAIPMAIIFGMISIYILPTQQILSSPLPQEVKMIYIAILGGLTILTAITFMGGRS